MAKGGSSKTDYSAYSYRELHEKKEFHVIMFLMLTVTLILSIISLVKTSGITGAAVTDTNTISVDDFLQKLTSHDEAKSYVGVSPLNIVQINSDNIANLQAQITGLDASYVGNFIVQYTDNIVIYDYAGDSIKATVSLQQPQQDQLSADFFNRLNAHPELQGLQNEQPVGGQIDTATLNTLQQQFPDVYANAKVGDFLLRYQTRLIIYDSNSDRIVNAVNLG